MTENIPATVPENMSLTVVANSCTSGACPTIYRTGSGSLVVQGYVVPARQAGVDVPDGEMLVEIPAELLAEALRNLS
ncbi:hypothetical protein [Actinoplanes sp. L3-i22]|uniref:hypothetical protein n=1 Tax=Actinoplanes sp. L3-i22 TaxID=2836373 RepID=UPI0021063255|nr:hypothetical protein [Actinoplanes sp. L3-i22]